MWFFYAFLKHKKKYVKCKNEDTQEKHVGIFGV